MKRNLKLLAALTSSVAMAAMSISPSISQGGTNAMDTDAIKAERKTQERVHRAIGIVTKVAREMGVLMIAHEPVASLDWPAMTMTFAVRDEALFDKVEQGDTISFDFVQSGESYTVIRID